MGKKQLLALVLLFVVLASCDVKPDCQEDPTQTPHGYINFSIPEKYKQKIPPFKPGCPTEVNLIMYPWGIGDISITNMYFEVSLYLKLEWMDYRLNITNTISSELNLDDEFAARIWTPDISFRNCITCNFIQFDYKRHKLLIKGKVLSYFVRTNAKLFCDFDLSFYPMDKHVCYIEVETYGDRKESVILVDGTTSHNFLRKVAIPQFQVSNLMTGMCSTPDGTSYYVTCIEYRLTFTRQLAYHLMLTYAPSLLIVLLTWISFWLEVDAAPPRIALGLTSLLTLATQFSNAQKNLPAVSYAKAIDIWMFTCIFMVFGSLLEFAIAYDLERKSKETVSRMTCIHLSSTKNPKSKNSVMKKQKSNVDAVSKVVFPLTFLIFNICYWCYFCTR